MELISKKQKQFKANLHCHSTLSDGKLTPEQLKEAYKERGYSVLAITDHEYPKCHKALGDSNFLMLTGYEGYIRVDPSAEYKPYVPEIHLNLFAKEQDNESLICYNKNYSKYIFREEGQVTKRRVGSERIREYNTDYINEYIETAKNSGYLVAYNHPYWSMEREEDILSYRGCFSLEIYNHSSYVLNHLEHNGMLYDKMLSGGMNMFCHAADDNHNRLPFTDEENDSFGGFTFICADSLEYGEIIHSLETGNFYASTGPEIYSLTLENRHAHIECSGAKHIFAYTGSKSPMRLHASKGGKIVSGDFDIDEQAGYVRFTVIDENEHIAYTRGYFLQ